MKNFNSPRFKAIFDWRIKLFLNISGNDIHHNPKPFLMQTSYQKITVNTQEGAYFFNPEEIVRLEASSNYTYMYFTNRKPMLIAKVLGLYEDILTEFGFLRTHRSHLVNTRHILFIDGRGNIIMQDTSRAEVSRRKKKEVMKELRNSPFSALIAA